MGPKKVIIRQGHQGLYFYFVISGRGVIKVVRRRADGSIMNGERVVFKIERGSSFGVSTVAEHEKNRL